MQNIDIRIIDAIRAERDRQDKKYGDMNKDAPILDYAAFMGEEAGEALRAALDIKYKNTGLGSFLEEVVQTAAVAIATLQKFGLPEDYYPQQGE